jgi:hypothetical protein
MARSPSVVLTEQDRYNMVSSWTDAIVVSRSRRRSFSVYARKYAEMMDARSTRRWLTLESTSGLKDPKSLLAAIESAASALDLEVDWDEAVAALGRLDWVIGASVADSLEWTLPSIPSYVDLAAQRASLARARIELQVEWGYDQHTIALAMSDWLAVLHGEPLSIQEPYWYGGDRFTAKWALDGTGGGSLVVSYDEGGVGYSGALSSVTIRGPAVYGIDVAQLLLKAAYS